MTDYTRSQADRLRAITVAGEIANLIRQIPQDVELPTAAIPVGIGPTVINTCGLTITIKQPVYVLCDGATAMQALAIVHICSATSQTVTATASVSASPCVSNVTEMDFDQPGGGSTWTANVGDCVDLDISVAYDSCNTGTTGTVELTLSTNQNCTRTVQIPIMCTTWIAYACDTNISPTYCGQFLVPSGLPIGFGYYTTCLDSGSLGCGLYIAGTAPAGTTFQAVIAGFYYGTDGPTGDCCGSTSCPCDNPTPCSNAPSRYTNDPCTFTTSIQGLTDIGVTAAGSAAPAWPVNHTSTCFLIFKTFTQTITATYSDSTTQTQIIKCGAIGTYPC